MIGVDPGLLARAVTKVETLKVFHTKLTQQQAVAILTGVSEGSKLAKLDINGNNLSGVDQGQLDKAVIKLKTLDVSDTELTQQQAVTILTAISEGSKFTKLDISCNDLPEVDPGLLAKAVTKLETFEVRYTELTQQQAVKILTAISEGSKLAKLDIGWDDLKEVDPGMLAKVVTKLETLKVGITKLTQQQAVAILTAVSEGSKLATLDINWNDLSGVDPGMLAKAVAKLVTLNVRRTNLTHQQTVAILTAVSEGSKLTELDISCNNLSGLDPGLLARAVTKLETLEVIDTKLTQQQAVAILTTVSKGSKLTKLYIS